MACLAYQSLGMAAYYINAGARRDDNVSKRYNYGAMQQVDIP
jgi:hypothetical protein